MVAAPMTALLKKRLKKLTWRDTAQTNFKKTKESIYHSSCCSLPRSRKQFVKESHTHRRHDVGNRELLAIKDMNNPSIC